MKFKSVVILLFIICLFFLLPKCFTSKINDQGVLLGGEGFLGYIDYKFFNKLSSCTPYTTPKVVHAPLGIPVDSFKTQIVGLQENMCVVRDLSKDSFGAPWEVMVEYKIPMTDAKNLSTMMMLEIKNPGMRLKHIKEYCASAPIIDDACTALQNGSDKNNYFLHIDLKLDNYRHVRKHKI